MMINAQGYMVETDMTDWVYIPDDVDFVVLCIGKKKREMIFFKRNEEM